MRVLVGCEESGYIRSEFRRFGHDAWSCDLLPAADGSAFHYQEDVRLAIQRGWDLAILHPPCTALCLAGNRHYAGTPERDEALLWTVALWQHARRYCNATVIEQPASVLTLPDAEKQTVHPWNFRLAEAKQTVLHRTPGLPALKPWVTQKPRPVHAVVWKMPPSKSRSRMRGHLPWLARPMVEQWGCMEATR